MRIGVWLGALLAAGFAVAGVGAHAQDAKMAFAPVPEEQRARLDERLKEVTAAYRQKDWAALFDLVSEANRKQSHGKPMGKVVFAYSMSDGYESYLLRKFGPAHTVNAYDPNYDIYGCGEFPPGHAQAGADRGGRANGASARRVVLHNVGLSRPSFGMLDAARSGVEAVTPFADGVSAAADLPYQYLRDLVPIEFSAASPCATERIALGI
jgi:hypothetical protein